MLTEIRTEFPFFAARPELTYLDSAATTQKPQVVLEAMDRHLRTGTANPGRGSYRLASTLTSAIEEVRARAATFIGAGDPASVAFTNGATGSLNAITQCWGAHNLRAGDEVLLSPSDHAANVEPWFQLAERTGVRIVPYQLTASGIPDLTDVAEKVTPATKVVVLTHVHNVFGERTDIAEIRRRIGSDIVISVDAAQSVGHIPLDTTALGADFVAFSAHKMFGPPGVGVLWAAPRVAADMRPAVVGGGMSGRSGLTEIVEAGTLNTVGIVGFGAALGFIESIGTKVISARLSAMTRILVERLKTMSNVELLPGTAFSTGLTGYGIVSFRVPGMSAADAGFVLDADGICVRTGGHCAHDSQLAGESVRISAHIYNTDAELDRVCKAVAELQP